MTLPVADCYCPDTAGQPRKMIARRMSIALPLRARREHVSRSKKIGILALAIALGIGASFSAQSAQAVGMSAVTGTISCNIVQSVGASATAKGDVYFQLNNTSQANTVAYINMGSSSVYAPWGWKFFAVAQAGAFYAYGLGTIGNAYGASRYCQATFG